MQIDAAKREIIARAYLDSLLASPPTIAPADIHQYYVENPALFSRRRIYTLEGLVLSANPDELEPIKRMIGEGKDLQSIAKYLKARNIEFAADSGVRKAEQIPLTALPSLSMAEDGSTTLIDAGPRYYIYHVITSQQAPVDEASARPRIATFLANQQGQRVVAQEVKRLKANAHIEYMGDFAKPEAGKSADTVATLK
jgi:EpsD family peptidyl-prolyl cis-trans isomerase